jgi:tRNA nucleotidyltransferase (CCA-adding enzyme)
MQVNTNITQNLTNDEKEIFSIIKQVVEKYTPTTKVYAVGGWTRDKLLNVPSDDIDIMVSNISGEKFARLVTGYMGSKEAHTIKSNPEKSKNITTSKAYLTLSSGKVQEVDFAQARQEVYRDNSRIPDIKPATPEEDAHRRDLTINSIFYNIIENKLEDFTGKGIKDLITDTIRTPLDPIKTFSEDPLRIFRVIRFSAKYNGKIDPETYQAMTNPELRNEIKTKVSKERIGQEFLKMLKNPNPEQSIALLKNTGLLEDVIREAVKGTPYEGKLAELDMDQNNPHHKLSLWGHTFQTIINVLESYKDAEPEKRIVMILAALTHDMGKLYKDIWGVSRHNAQHRSYHGHEDESGKIATLILKYLKLEQLIPPVSLITQSHMTPHSLLRDNASARTLRKFIRQLGEKSADWLDVFNIALADAYSKDTIRDPNTVQEYQNLKTKLENALSTLTPTSATLDIKPILNGNEIMQILNIKAGPIIKTLLEFVKELKDENPEITKEEAINQLKSKYQELNPIKQASKKDNTNPACPKQLLETKIKNINEAFKDKRYFEVLTISNELKDNYGNDENVIRVLAKVIFELAKYNECQNNNLIQFILDKAQKNFFDDSICPYVVGVLLLINSHIEDEVIIKMGKRMNQMAPESMKNMLESLPEKVNREDLRRKLQCEND